MAEYFDRTIGSNKTETIGQKLDWVAGTAPPTPVYAQVANTTGWLVSRNNRRSRDGSYRNGSAFFLHEWGTKVELSGHHTVWRPGGLIPAYEGAFAADVPAYFTPPAYDRGVNPANAHGADAWAHARERLTKPDFSFLQPLAELRELPSLLKGATRNVLRDVFHPSRRRQLKAAGQLNLAYQFGWAPIWSDVAKFLKAHRDSQKRAVQLIRDEGKPVRREGTLFDRQVSNNFATSTLGSASSNPTLVSQCYKSSGRRIRFTMVEERAWYVGQFRYWLPPGPKDTIAYRNKLARALSSGATLTPADAYNLIPWTWLIDYYSGLGDFFDAVSKGVEDRLAADYFYVMLSRDSYSMQECGFDVFTSKDGKTTEHVATRSERRSKMRSRVRASPFGFGLSEGNLSPMQWSILGSLGLSRLSG